MKITFFVFAESTFPVESVSEIVETIKQEDVLTPEQTQQTPEDMVIETTTATFGVEQPKKKLIKKRKPSVAPEVVQPEQVVDFETKSELIEDKKEEKFEEIAASL